MARGRVCRGGLVLSVEDPGIAAVRDLAAGGALQIFDPNPDLGRMITWAGSPPPATSWQATVLSAFRLLPGQPSPTGFVLRRWLSRMRLCRL